MIFKVPVTYEVYGVVEVEAESIDDLMKKLDDTDFVNEMPLPDNPDYVDGTYSIDKDTLEVLNNIK